MTVHVLETRFQLPEIDLSAVNTHRAQLRHTAESLADIYLPVKREILLSLLQELGGADQAALDVLTALPGTLDGEGLEDLLTAIKRLKGDPPDAPTLETISAIAAEIQTQVQRQLGNIRDKAVSLDDALVNLAHVSVGEVDHLMTAVEADIVHIDERLAAESGPQAKLLEQEAAVNKLIAEIEAISLWDKLKPLVESLTVLTDIDPKNPLIGSIKAGIEGLSNILNLASSQLRYEHLVRHRDRLQAQLDELTGNVRELRQQRQAESRKLEQLKQLKLIEAPKQAYGEELGKLLDALKRFLGLHPALPDDDIEATASAFLAHGRLFSDYLNDLRRAWRN
ncbi:alpha-xenorhabdolysin family binary toxin subunit B [Pseudomonas sp. DTU_2021_1001937_2_SI_NGA_ILE_001]|uniref:alpha-xenorhabdolysin family binary toxin subunit B n=1 Tax=Pseudomonas sp. DTU_2021_1001937_2_SI_NGA_ILE_001 TaxID=3077589 RepID=UPI0028FC270D|nr:alpha-xenorhabdolysin family binary toxin subunit B [Pseudomonas sp. DTU_2021_1001937_2_SI_NGA_ILE_001]WNW13274.1 alpha-xenorhabdolysin family binary toxin subunit B [Pseudomonas sp. DTU_2021_1001937_2_SI_NGA_ILE_001]